MQKKTITLLLTLMCALTLSGCNKNIDKMSDEELYTYLSEMTEDELTKATSYMTEEQQIRASMVLMLMEAQEKQEQDDFATDLSIPIFQDTEELAH